jgi:hypothetical protein
MIDDLVKRLYQHHEAMRGPDYYQAATALSKASAEIERLNAQVDETLRSCLTAALVEAWRPIEEAPKDRPILLAAYIVPSDEAQRNGLKPFWHIATGRAFGTKLDRWTNVLGEKPSHWMPLPPSPGAADE